MSTLVTLPIYLTMYSLAFSKFLHLTSNNGFHPGFTPNLDSILVPGIERILQRQLSISSVIIQASKVGSSTHKGIYNILVSLASRLQ